MTTKLLHQIGHMFKWNLDWLSDHSENQGIICAARYMGPDKIGELDLQLKRRSLFDPQFYVPGSSIGKLSEYEFFPDVIADGFETANYATSNALGSAEKCVTFQVENEFESVVIPSRYREGTPTDFIEAQSDMFVEPFLQVMSSKQYSKPILLQLIVNDAIIKDERMQNSILNWLTGIKEINGVYLISNVRRPNKQIKDINYLVGMLNFINSLRSNDLEVILGFQNTESVLMLGANPTSITFGGYENLRIFNLSAFDDSESKGRGPSARIYSSSLLQWIDNMYVSAISELTGDINKYFDQSEYRITMFEPTYNWHFTKPEPYKHYFSAFTKQVAALVEANLDKTIENIRSSLENAKDNFAELEQAGIVLDSNSDGSHIPVWLTSLNMYLHSQN